MSAAQPDPQAAWRLLPSIDELLRDARAVELLERGGRGRVQLLATRLLEELRAAIRTGELGAAELERRIASGGLLRELEAQLARELGRGAVRCVNATGVVLNTGLGRAPVHPEVAAAMAQVAGGYCVLEVDRFTNERNQRDAWLGELVARATGAQAAIAVNNCAGAVLLAFNTFAGGRQAVVSRGELVEIGGSFRVPDVMARAGVEMVEVGTTNRTRLADYERAIGPRTGLLVKVHTSNFRVTGFTQEVGAAELAALGRARGVASVWDLGSGLLELDGEPPLAGLLGGEPSVGAALSSGVDAVLFSGDKLLGAPQAGLIAGQREAVAALRANPIYRALRLDKSTLRGLECTFELILTGRGGELPARALLLTGADELRQRAEQLQRELAGLPGVAAAVQAGESQPGSGSAPTVRLPTFVVRLAVQGLSAEALARRLREAAVPVFVRIHEGAVLLDPRTLLPGDADDLVSACRQALQRPGPP